VFAVATGLRLWGIGHSLPYSYYPDEAHFVKRALSFGSGDLNPHWFHKPALYMYLLFAEYGALFLVGKVAGLWGGVGDFAVRYILDPTAFYLLGRLTTMAFSLGTLWLVYRIGERWFGRGAGLAGAMVFAVIPGVVTASQHVKEDIPSMFFATLSLFFVFCYMDGRKTGSLALAAIAAGASAATKAYGMALLVPIAVSIFAGAGRPTLRRALALGAAAFALFWVSHFALAPYSFLDPLGREATFGRIAALASRFGEILGVARPEPLPDEFIGRQTGFLGGFADYFRVLVSPQGMGITAGLAALLGLSLVLLRRGATGRILVGYTVLFAIVSVILYPGYATPRHQTPVYPTLCLGAGAVILLVWRYLPRVAAGLVTAGILAYPGAAVATRAVEVSKEDTRNVAKRWVEKHVPSGALVLADENGPPLLLSTREIHRAIERAASADAVSGMARHYDRYLDLQAQAARHGITYDLHEIRKAWWRPSEATGEFLTSDYDRDMANPFRPVGVRTYDEYVSRGFRFAVVHSAQYEEFLTPGGASRWPSYARLYADLFRHGELVQEFSRADGRWTGPTVRVIRFVPR
jgi:hypothetical protein